MSWCENLEIPPALTNAYYNVFLNSPNFILYIVNYILIVQFSAAVCFSFQILVIPNHVVYVIDVWLCTTATVYSSNWMDYFTILIFIQQR
jgi:hypothetical protein